MFNMLFGKKKPQKRREEKKKFPRPATARPTLKEFTSPLAIMPDLKEFTSFDNYLLDCDGVIGGIEEEDSKTSVATINYLLGFNKRVFFITNNSNRSRADFIKELE